MEGVGWSCSRGLATRRSRDRLKLGTLRVRPTTHGSPASLPPTHVALRLTFRLLGVAPSILRRVEGLDRMSERCARPLRRVLESRHALGQGLRHRVRSIRREREAVLLPGHCRLSPLCLERGGCWQQPQPAGHSRGRAPASWPCVSRRQQRDTNMIVRERTPRTHVPATHTARGTEHLASAGSVPCAVPLADRGRGLLPW